MACCMSGHHFPSQFFRDTTVMPTISLIGLGLPEVPGLRLDLKSLPSLNSSSLHWMGDKPRSDRPGDTCLGGDAWNLAASNATRT